MGSRAPGSPATWPMTFITSISRRILTGIRRSCSARLRFNVVQTVNKPVRTLDDLKGLKLRGTGRIADIVKALGATPIPLEMPDLYDGLKRNLCEGALLSIETLEGFKTGELIKYLTPSWRIGCAYCFYVVMNKDKWGALPPDVQKVITDFSKEFIERWTVEWVNIDISALNFFKNKGGKVESIPEEDNPRWIKAVQSRYRRLQERLDLQGLQGCRNR